MKKYIVEKCIRNSLNNLKKGTIEKIVKIQRNSNMLRETK